MRTHPPVIASFPPLPVSDTQSDRSGRHSNGSGPTSGPQVPRKPNGLDAGHPDSRLLHVPAATTAESSSVTVEALATGKSQFLTLDVDRFDAFSPSPHAMFPSPLQRSPSTSRRRRQSSDANGHTSAPTSPSRSGFIAFPKSPDGRKASRLPNPRFDFDVGLLNLHLHLRVADILGCAESMWDYVLDYQQLHRQRHPSSPVARGLAHPKMSRKRAADDMHKALMTLTRRGFDELLSRFELYVLECCSTATSLTFRFQRHEG